MVSAVSCPCHEAWAMCLQGPKQTEERSCSCTACWLSQWSPDPDSRNDSMEVRNTIRLLLCNCVLLGALRERRWHGRPESSLSRLCPCCKLLTREQETLCHLAQPWQWELCEGKWSGWDFPPCVQKPFSLLDSQVGLQLGLSGCQRGVTECSCKYSLFLLSASLLTL